jgi:uncharacterized protein YejL (UPF0352 family)
MTFPNHKQLLQDLETVLKKHNIPEGCLLFSIPNLDQTLQGVGIAHIAKGTARNKAIRAVKEALSKTVIEQEMRNETDRLSKNN